MTEKGNKRVMTLYVLRSNTHIFLSLKAANKFGFVKRRDLVFGEICQIKCEPVGIKLRDDAQPYVQTTARRILIPIFHLCEVRWSKMASFNA